MQIKLKWKTVIKHISDDRQIYFDEYDEDRDAFVERAVLKISFSRK